MAVHIRIFISRCSRVLRQHVVLPSYAVHIKPSYRGAEAARVRAYSLKFIRGGID